MGKVRQILRIYVTTFHTTFHTIIYHVESSAICTYLNIACINSTTFCKWDRASGSISIVSASVTISISVALPTPASSASAFRDYLSYFRRCYTLIP